MNQALQSFTELTLGEDTYRLAFDFEAIAEAEDLTDRPLLTGLTKRNVNHPTISFVRAMFYAALRRNHPTISLGEASAKVTKATFADIWGKVLEAWVAAMEDAGEADVAEDPTKAQS